MQRPRFVDTLILILYYRLPHYLISTPSEIRNIGKRFSTFLISCIGVKEIKISSFPRMHYNKLQTSFLYLAWSTFSLAEDPVRCNPLRSIIMSSIKHRTKTMLPEDCSINSILQAKTPHLPPLGLFALLPCQIPSSSGL